MRFETTPKMSTYLLYLGVGEFEFLDDKYNDVAIRVVTTAGKKEQGRFSLENTKKFLKYFEDFSGISTEVDWNDTKFVISPSADNPIVVGDASVFESFILNVVVSPANNSL